jgi:hypothetical protein
MKVLILVQSFDKENTYRTTSTGEIIKFNYKDLMNTQRETWDSIEHPDVKTLYYLPDLTRSGIEKDIIYVKDKPDMQLMFNHFIRALVYAMKFEWDYIFKTDNSAYVCKSELVKVLEDKPRTKFYGGMYYTGPNSGDVPFFWGEGFTLSRDIAQKLIEIASVHTILGTEDSVLGHLLKNEAQWDSTMTILDFHKDPFVPAHVYRCRKEGLEIPMVEDIKSMKEIHENFSLSNVMRD